MNVTGFQLFNLVLGVLNFLSKDTGELVKSRVGCLAPCGQSVIVSLRRVVCLLPFF